MWRPIKSQDSFKIEQKGALPTKVISLRLRNYSSTGRLYLFWLLPTKNDPSDIQSGRPINKSTGFWTKILNMLNPVSRPIRGALPTKVISLRLRNYSSTGRLYLFWLLPTKKDPLDIQSGRPINKLTGFWTKILNMLNPVSWPIRDLISRPDKSF